MPQPPNASAETDSDSSQSSYALPLLSRMPTEKYIYEEVETNLRRTYAIRLFNQDECIALTPEEDTNNYNNMYEPKGPE